MDVGCASGFFLDIAKERGISTYGVELSTEGVNKAKQKHSQIINDTLENARFPDSFFDVITLYDIIEHVLDPTSTIKEISRIIKPGGIVAISTPDITSWHAKLLGKRWGMITPWEHLHYFSPYTIRVLLEKNGFSINEIKKNYKIFTLDYLFKMAEFYFPRLYKIFPYISKLIPERVLKKERLFYFGEMQVFAIKNENHSKRI